MPYVSFIGAAKNFIDFENKIVTSQKKLQTHCKKKCKHIRFVSKRDKRCHWIVYANEVYRPTKDALVKCTGKPMSYGEFLLYCYQHRDCVGEHTE